MDRKSFVIYCSWEEMLKVLTDEEKGRFLMALIDYEKNGTIPTKDSKIEMAFGLVKAKLDEDMVAYELICERNRLNGSKGGRPSKPTDK